MNVLYLNPTFHTALLSQSVPIKEIFEKDALDKYLSYQDQELILRQTEALLKLNLLKDYDLHPKVSSDQIYIRSSYDHRNSEDRAIRVSVSEDAHRLQALAVNSELVVLFYDPANAAEEKSTIENVFCALASITSMQSVMKTKLFRQYAAI